jgi:CelD/BcsL family acetyltransferase involved in cellulose biosynthesis
MQTLRTAIGNVGEVRLPPASAAETTTAILPADSRLSLVTALADFEELEGPWRALEADARPHNVFQSFSWCSAYARNYAAPSPAVRLSIITGYHRDRLVFVWPLMKVRLGPVTVLRWLSDPFGQYGDIIIAKGHCPMTWMRAGWSYLAKHGGASIVRLRHVREDAAAYPFLRETFRDSRVDEGAPFLDLGKFSTEAAYEARYGKEQRRRRKRIRKSLEELGPLEFRMLSSASEMERQMEAALAEKRKWIEERSLWSKALGCPKLHGLLHAAGRGSGAMSIVTSVLTAGGRPISWEIGLRFKDTHFGFITAHDTKFTDASPARLHMDLSQRRAIADGMRVFDLMVPLDRHKDSWSNAVMPVRDFHRPLSALGWLYGLLYLEWLRPGLRRAYYNAPSRWRHIISGLKHTLAR